MKKMIAVGILFGTLALSAMPALAQTTNCTQDMFGVHCNTFGGGYGMQTTNCTRDMFGVHCNTFGGGFGPSTTHCTQDMFGVHCITY
jgi:hypothetical protein